MLFARKKKEENEQEPACACCVWSRKENGKLYCVKKRKQTDGDAACSLYEYDLTKRVPPPFPDAPEWLFTEEDA